MKQRTEQQNKALHLYFEKLSEMLNDSGYSVMKTLRHDAEIDWTPTLIKELMWRKIQKAMYDKQSTSDLTSEEVILVFDTINRHLGTKFGIHVPFPSIEGLVEEDKLKRDYSYPKNEYDEEPDFNK